MVNNNLNEINAVIDSSQKITASGGFWWLKRFMEPLGVGAVFAQDYGIKKRRRRFSERDYFLSVLYSLLSGGKAISDIGKIRKDKAFKRLSGLTRGIPTAGAEFAYKPIGIAEPQRVAVRRFRKSQPGLFDEYNYPFVMTNRGGLTAKEIFDIHSTKSGYENNFKDLLSGLGLHHPRFMKLQICNYVKSRFVILQTERKQVFLLGSDACV